MKDFVSFDVETANSKYGSICSFGVVVVKNGIIVNRVTHIVQPPATLNYFDWRNVEIHGITPSIASTKPMLEHIWPELMSLLGNGIVVCHNAGFDINAVRQAAEALGEEKPQADYFCTLKASRKLLNLQKYSLPLVADELGVSVSHHHDALYDAEAAAEIALALMRRTQTSTVRELANHAGVPVQTI